VQPSNGGAGGEEVKWLGEGELAEKLAMGPKPSEAESLSIRFSVDQHEIRLDVAVPVSSPIAAEVMIPVMGV